MIDQSESYKEEIKNLRHEVDRYRDMIEHITDEEFFMEKVEEEAVNLTALLCWDENKEIYLLPCLDVEATLDAPRLYLEKIILDDLNEGCQETPPVVISALLRIVEKYKAKAKESK